MRILVLAYACDPEEGSEPGAGWMWSRLLARFGEAIVITRANNRRTIERALATTPEARRLRFVFVDLPAWARSWKRGGRGIRLYAVLWQLAALRIARRLHRARPFDAVWHITLSTHWLGSVGGLVGPPFVFGPVGGGVRACLDPRLVGVRGLGYELARALVRRVNEVLNPLVRSALARSSLVLAVNEDTRRRMPSVARAKAIVFPNLVLDPPEDAARPSGRPDKVALFAARLLPWKGVTLAVRALSLLPGWRLVICGDGPDRDRVRRLADRLAVAGRVELRGRIPRHELHRVMREEATLLVFPSLHDDGGWVVGEAALRGLPVVCLRRGGPPIISKTPGVPVRGLRETVEGLAQRIRQASEEPAPPGSAREWEIQSRERALRTLLGEAGFDVPETAE